jgi:integrase
MLFDPRAAKLLQPGEHIVVDGCKGLRLEATTVGKAWTYRYKSPVDGRMRQIKIGNWPAVSASAAASKWQEIKDQRDAGIDPSVQKKAKRIAAAEGVYTVAKMVEDYYSGHLKVNRKEVGANAVHARLKKETAVIGKRDVAGLTRKEVYALIEAIADRPVHAKSVRNEMGAATSLALDAGKIPEETPNWWRQIMVGKLRSKGAMRDGKRKGTGKRVLSDVEVAQLVVEDFHGFPEKVRDVLTLYLWTAARGGELVQMHTDHITEEPDGLWWTCPKEWFKNARLEEAFDLRVPLVGRAKDVVERRMKDRTGYLFAAESSTGFTSQATIQSQVHFRQPYSKARPEVNRKRLVVTHWSPHDLRRTTRTRLAGMGCPMEIGEAILGHVLPGVKGIYNLHAYDAERRLWLGKWADRLESILAGHQAAA